MGSLQEATWVLLGEQDNFKVEKRDLLAVSENGSGPLRVAAEVKLGTCGSRPEGQDLGLISSYKN